MDFLNLGLSSSRRTGPGREDSSGAHCSLGRSRPLGETQSLSSCITTLIIFKKEQDFFGDKICAHIKQEPIAEERLPITFANRRESSPLPPSRCKMIRNSWWMKYLEICSDPHSHHLKNSDSWDNLRWSATWIMIIIFISIFIHFRSNQRNFWTCSFARL